MLDDPFADLPAPTRWPPHITVHADMVQGSDEWLAARCGMLTASEMKLILTPTLKPAANDKERAHLHELLAQRITGFVEPHFVTDDMLRGQMEEQRIRDLYALHVAPVEQVGFIVNGRWGFRIGCSPDGLVGAEGLLECKSRRARFQVQTIVDHVARDGGRTIPDDYAIQAQTALLVTERAWLDLVSYCGGLPLAVLRVWPDDLVQDAILEAAARFEERLAERLALYRDAAPRLIPTERIIEQELAI